jgi:hypothetical protein
MRTAQLYCNIAFTCEITEIYISYYFLVLSSSGIIVVYLTSSCVNWGFFGTRGPVISKKAQFVLEM